MEENEKKFDAIFDKEKEIIEEVKTKGKNVRNLNKIERAAKIICYGEKYIELCRLLIEKHGELCKAKMEWWEEEDSSKKKSYEEEEEAFKEAKANLLKKMIKYREDKDLKKSFKEALKIPAFLKEKSKNNN